MSGAHATAEHGHEVDEILDGVRRLLLDGRPVRLVIESPGADLNRVTLNVEHRAHGLRGARVLLTRLTQDTQAA